MKRRVLLFVLLSCLLSPFAFGQEKDLLSFSFTPGAYLPLGASADYFEFGAAVSLSAEYRLPALPLMGFRVETGYDYVPIRSAAEDVVHVPSAGGGLALVLSPWSFLKARLIGSGGYYYPIVTDPAVERIGNAYLTVGVGVHFLPNPALTVGLETRYRKYFDFYDSIALYLGTSFTPLKTSPLEIKEIELRPVFPVLFKYYNDHPIGDAVLENGGSVPIEDISVTVFVENYMDNPKECPAPSVLKPGQRADIKLYVLFSEKVLDITEDTMVSARLTLSYTLKDKEETRTRSETLRMYNRNAVTWDDDRKAAAYVTTRDPNILQLSKNVTGWSKALAPAAINSRLSAAMGIHEALRMSGITYVVDPRTPFIEFSKNKLAVDFLQFPVQTLTYKAGDCDDLSILYSTLLESIGIGTAFITIPGHIFLAFSLDMPPDKAKAVFLDPTSFIFLEENTWLPFEITMVQEDFLTAWRKGAEQWRENESGGTAQFYPMTASWELYEPVGFLKGDVDVTLPSKEIFERRYTDTIDRFVSHEIGPRVIQLEEMIRQARDKRKYLNKLGVLYARYGLNDKATEQFRNILDDEEYRPALVNLGNIYFTEGNMESALDYYKRAYRLSPTHSGVLLQLARTYYDLQDYDKSDQIFAELKRVKPEIAERFAYLDLKSGTQTRAAAGDRMEEIPWDEE